MNGEILERKAKELYATASNARVSQMLYRDSIRANWNPHANCFDRLMIHGMMEDRTVPSRNKSITLHFLAADGTDVASLLARLEKKRTGIHQMKTPKLAQTDYRRIGR